MAIIVHSPHDGQPVKVRDQDLQRAIRDSEGRIFYAVKRSDGSGYYGALTRKGSEKDEQRYLSMLEKMETAREVGKERSARQVHDATGRSGGPGLLRWVLLLIVAAIIALIAWQMTRPDKPGGVPAPGEVQPQEPQDNDAAEGHASRRAVITKVTDSSGVPYNGGGYIATASGLRYRILEPGTGETATAGRYVLVHYLGARLTGEVFDHSIPKQPVGFVLWTGAVPRGWDEGIAGMRVGETRRLILTPDLQHGPYPGAFELPDGTLQFDIELVNILPGVRYTILETGGGPIVRSGDIVEVQYKAYINREQTPYDSTYIRGRAEAFAVGSGELIPGWDLGVTGMTEGEVREIEIPPYLAYGRRGAAGVIPPGASLRYTIELKHVQSLTARQARAHRDGGG